MSVQRTLTTKTYSNAKTCSFKIKSTLIIETSIHENLVSMHLHAIRSQKRSYSTHVAPAALDADCNYRRYSNIVSLQSALVSVSVNSLIVQGVRANVAYVDVKSNNFTLSNKQVRSEPSKTKTK